MIYDLIIVGMGPAGVSAAIYAKRAGLNVLCFEEAMVGGYLNYIDRIDNYPGLYGISGPDFAFKLYDSIKELNIDFKNESIKEIVDGSNKMVITNKDTYYSKNVIMATGRSPRKLGLEKEESLYGRGISHCALCDGNFYKNKDVAVLGGGNSALQEALYLSNICNKVYLIHRKDNFRVGGQIVESVNNKANIIQILGKNVVSLKETESKLSSIVLDDNKEIKVDGLFIYIGFVPNTKMAAKLGITNEDGYISVDKNYETKVRGIYAIGDIVKKDIYQISTAVSDGTIAVSKITDNII